MAAGRERITLLREMLACVNTIYLTEYDNQYNCVSTNVPHFDLFYLFFTCDDTIQEILPVEENENLKELHLCKGPSIFTNRLGIAWLSDVEVSGDKVERIHMLGPVFLDEVAVKNIVHEVDKLQISLDIRRKFLGLINSLPVITINRFYEYGIMLHYCITGEKVQVADFNFPELEGKKEKDQLAQEKYSSYLAESEILTFVEEGNLEYSKQMSRYISREAICKGDKKNYLRQAKNTVIIFCALCARAAVKGGLSSEIAYKLREQYVQEVEDTMNLAELNQTNRKMLDDYIRKVHRIKVQMKGISPQMKESCDYISLHVEEQIDIHSLASRLGYTDYYFSTKFKKEVGVSVRTYVMQKKIEKAMELLVTTHKEVQDISCQLGYSSQSHFGDVFRKVNGMSPGEYRQLNK